MLEAWLNRTRDWLKVPEQLLPLPEQEFAQWALARVCRQSRHAALACPLAYVWGEAGSGKSSLIRQELRTRSPDLRGRMIVAQAAEWLAEISEDSPTAERFDFLSHADLLVCEDLHDLDAAADETVRLVSLLNHAVEMRLPVIVTADRLPSQLPHAPPRLINRLQGGLLAGIRPLPGSSKQRLGTFWVKEGLVPARGASVRLYNDPAIVTAGLLQSRLLERNLPDSINDGSMGVRRNSHELELVAEVVSRDFHLTVQDLRSGARRRTLQVPRDVAMSLARELTPYPLAVIGHFFGCQSHTSVGRSASRLKQRLSDTPTLRQQVQLLRTKLRQELSADCG